MSDFSHAVDKYSDAHTDEGTVTLGTNGLSKPLTEFVGHSTGTLIAMVRGGVVVDSATFNDGLAVTASTDVVNSLTAVAAETAAQRSATGTSPTASTAKPAASDEQTTTNVPQTIQLPGLGNYLISVEMHSTYLLIAGVSLAPSQSAVGGETLTLALLAAAVLLLTIIGIVVVVRLALRPLARVVETAVVVTTLKLDSGEAAIASRVPPGDTDPRTEIGKVGDALNRMLDHVESALGVRAATDQRMRRFVTDASHELRTPLSAIQGYAELTRQDSEILPQMTEYALARIEAESLRMSSLVDELLLLARIDEGQDLQTEEVDLADVVTNAVNDANAAASGHRWVTEVPHADALVVGDQERLYQLFANLLANAHLHTPAQTTICTTVRVLGRAIEVTVEDDGPGIPDDLVPTLFERFTRGDASRARGSGAGTGLGLAIVLSIVEAHNGTITVQSNARGTRFTVALPTVAPARAPEQNTSLPHSAIAHGAGTRHPGRDEEVVA
ncbi:MAG: Two component sensor histidine kinase [Subtercola sp.]|nr:Two component sensor histidine kinase [Subtercola sp.]